MSKSQLRVFCALALGSALAAPAYSQTAKLSRQDASFVKEATQVNDYEIVLGRYAALHGASGAVKAFGSRMVSDHTKANDKLKSIADQDGFKLPTTLAVGLKLNSDRIKLYKGTAFDRAYLKDMVKGHTGFLKDVAKEAATGQNPDVKAYASSIRPVVAHHLKMAKADQAALNGSRTSKMGKM